MNDPFAALRPLGGIQAVVTLFLVVLLRILYARLRDEEFLKWWAHAWAAYGLGMGATWVALGRGPGWAWAEGLATLAAFLQGPCWFLGASAHTAGWP